MWNLGILNYIAENIFFSVADKSQSSSTGMSSAEDIDDPFNPIEHYPDEGDKYVNYKRKPLQQPAKEVYNTGTSSEDR